jgi:hypothetical protein
VRGGWPLTVALVVVALLSLGAAAAVWGYRLGVWIMQEALR